MRRIAIILGLMALLPGAARADITIPLAHAKLHLPIPGGYCPLDTERARESMAFDSEQKSYQGQNRLLAMAVDCAELEGFRAHERPFEHYVTFEATVKDDQLVRRPDTERAAFLDEMLQEVAKVGPKDATAENNHWLSNFNASAEIKEYGLIAHDENAVYLRLVGVIAGVRGRDPISIAKIYATTLTAGYEISIAVYAHGDTHALPGMLDFAKHEVTRLIAANPPPPPTVPPPPPITEEQVAANDPASQPDTIFGQSVDTIVTGAIVIMLVSLVLLMMFRPVRRRR